MTSDRAELAGEIQERMIRLIASVVLFNHAVSAKAGLGTSDSQFMTLLQTYGPLTPRQLTGHTGLTSGTVTGVVDRLESLGLVTRRPDPHDRRKVVVTPSAEAIQEKLVPLYAEQGERLRAVLATRSEEELRTISAFLADAAGDARPSPTSSARPSARPSGRIATPGRTPTLGPSGRPSSPPTVRS